MSSKTLEIILKHWDEEPGEEWPKGVFTIKAPFNIEEVCREIDALLNIRTNCGPYSNNETRDARPRPLSEDELEIAATSVFGCPNDETELGTYWNIKKRTWKLGYRAAEARLLNKK